MRKISGLQIFIFSIIYIFLGFFSFLSSQHISRALPLGSYESIVTVLLILIFFFVFAILSYRLFVACYPLPVGEIAPQSKYEFNYHIHLLYYLLIFHPIIRSNILPVPLMKLVFQGLGAKMGKNSFSAGIITDGMFVEIGDNTLIGNAAGIYPHAIENDRLSHEKIKIGNNVTIGTMAIVFSGVTIEDDAIVSAGAVVPKGTNIKRGEIWGGVPAKLIGKRKI